MKLFFADDSRNPRPTRRGVRPLIGVGGYLVDHSRVKSLGYALSALCSEVGFPDDPASGEFKWSPKRKRHWMYENLVDVNRVDFYRRALAIAQEHDVKAIVVAEEEGCTYAHTLSQSHEHDVTVMLLERVENSLNALGVDGIVIVDRYSGGRDDEDDFLISCIELIQEGTNFVEFSRIAMSVLCCPSKFTRLIQLADIVTGCVLSYVGGEQRFAPTIFEYVNPILYTEGQTVGGYGVKLHPDYRCGNLYHWLFGDHWMRGQRLPIAGRLYANNHGVDFVPL